MVVVVVINRAAIIIARTRSYPQAVIIILDEECNMHLNTHVDFDDVWDMGEKKLKTSQFST